MAPLKIYGVSHGALILFLRVFALRAVFEERFNPVNQGVTRVTIMGCLTETALFIV